MTIFIDTHAHLDHPMFSDDMDQVIERAQEAQVKVILAQGLDPVSNRAVLDLSKKYDIVRPALGIYPPDALAKEMEEDQNPRPLPEFDIDEELAFIKQSNPIALGEIGLEYKNGTDIPSQKVLFQKFIELSEKTRIPMIIHSRKAELDVVEMLESSNARHVLLHCFCGRKHLVKRAADNGWSFSVSTNIVRSEQFQAMAKEVHISQLFTETDSPYLSPFPGKRNEPAFVVEATKKIAELKGMTVEDTANNIFMNYQNLFLR